VVVGDVADSGPWPLFDALYAGVPVVGPAIGWAKRLLEDGTCGRLVSDAAEMGAAIEELLASRQAWHARREQTRARVAEFSLSAWVEANLQLAAQLAGGTLECVA
jgi:glycosyltransferase involved in cell wall biosynthesis